jgi:hypothetical protein
LFGCSDVVTCSKRREDEEKIREKKTLKKYLSRKACWFTCFEKIILTISEFRQSSDVHSGSSFSHIYSQIALAGYSVGGNFFFILPLIIFSP